MTHIKVSVSLSPIIGALKSGQVDAWSIVPHIAKPLSRGGAVHIIGNVADYLPNYQITTVFTSANNAKNERALTKNFLAGLSPAGLGAGMRVVFCSVALLLGP